MRRILLYMILIFLPTGISAANGLKKIASVPFRMVGSYIVIEVSINGSTKLNLILDSGVTPTIITELNAEDSLTLNYIGKTEIKGLGPGEGITAYTSYGNEFQAGKMKLTDQTTFLLEKDIFCLSKHVGAKINGILGANLFKDYIVKIDHNLQRITFFENKPFIIPKGYTAIPMIIEGNKMFVTIPVTEADWSTRYAQMLLDTGAELTAWFRSTGAHPIKLPEKRIRSYIGQGLNGEIEGYMGRIYMINIGGHILNHPIVHFPDSASITGAILASEREGTIGSQILSRFNLIFDQKRNMLYVKPNWKFNSPFNYNIAGIEMIQDDPAIPFPEICHVREGSPADLAGVQIGDRIIQVNEASAFNTNINVLRTYFETSSKNPLTILLMRGEENLMLKIEMKSVL